MTKLSAGTASFAIVLAAGVACAVAACSALAAGPGGAASGALRAGHSGRRSGAAPARPPARPPAPAVVTVRHLVLKDGHQMTVARFTGGLRFVLHCGSADPGRPCREMAAGPAVGTFDRRMLVAAFNGGFKLAAGAGGYQQEGRVISPLVPGRASLVIYRSGTASIGIWGRGVPVPGQPVYSVRQNLDLLVRNGRPTAASRAGWSRWGGTITGVRDTARSALGENAKGQLIYVASMSATPPDLAVALVKAGARIGMELDINAEWVQLAYARRPGGPLVKGIIGQVRPASQYLRGWTRDFIAVLATWPANPAPGIHVQP